MLPESANSILFSFTQPWVSVRSSNNSSSSNGNSILYDRTPTKTERVSHSPSCIACERIKKERKCQVHFQSSRRKWRSSRNISTDSSNDCCDSSDTPCSSGTINISSCACSISNKLTRNASSSNKLYRRGVGRFIHYAKEKLPSDRGRQCITHCYSSSGSSTFTQWRSENSGNHLNSNSSSDPVSSGRNKAPIASTGRSSSNSNGDNNSTSNSGRRVGLRIAAQPVEIFSWFEEQRIALLRGTATGFLAALVTSVCMAKRASAALKSSNFRRSFWRLNGGAFVCGATGGWWLTRLQERKYEERLMRLRRSAIPGMKFMTLDSLAPPLPADAYTAAGEDATAKLFQEEEQRRRMKK